MVANTPYYHLVKSPTGHVPEPSEARLPRCTFEDESRHLSAPSPYDERLPTLHAERTAQFSNKRLDNTDNNQNLDDLLHAASFTATGRDSAERVIENYEPAMQISTSEFGKRKTSSDPHTERIYDPLQPADSLAKRRRIDMHMDPQLSTALESPEVSCEEYSRTNVAPKVHSATALFRRTSEKSQRKWCTRPPMSKLFASLQLSPENFLQLQSQAKAYMLDSAHPERQECIGSRGKFDTDMIKLRLFNCVHEFLSSGVGEKYFGKHVINPGQDEVTNTAIALGVDKDLNTNDKLIWPDDGNKIISLVTPLMRRMVTNERQRVYAAESRKDHDKKKDKDDSIGGAVHSSNIATSPRMQGTIAELGQSTMDPNMVEEVPLAAQASPRRNTLDIPELSSMPLPSTTNSNPKLSNINIFVVIADHTSTPTQEAKLLEERITLNTNNTRNLIHYPWSDFCAHVRILLIQTQLRYPAIRNPLAPQPSGHVLQQDKQDTVVAAAVVAKEDLQGLAVAANALRDSVEPSDKIDPLDESVSHADNGSAEDPLRAGTQSIREASAASAVGGVESHHGSEEMLPRYRARTLGDNGWEWIGDEAQWSAMLLRRARSVWSDGVVNVIVELIDIPFAPKS